MSQHGSAVVAGRRIMLGRCQELELRGIRNFPSVVKVVIQSSGGRIANAGGRCGEEAAAPEIGDRDGGWAQGNRRGGRARWCGGRDMTEESQSQSQN